ncbi:hypothetical protein LCGC14_2929740 [marine sediment metagenome]|uniref:Uncharacterized protein n=1 Tax=marine sediment metagenome TaxID=412755 RepID=A0A0F9ACF4_9ZZZZ
MRQEKNGSIQFKIKQDYTKVFLDIMKDWEIPEGEFSFGSLSNKTIAENAVKEQMKGNRVWALLILKINDNVVGDIILCN